MAKKNKIILTIIFIATLVVNLIILYSAGEFLAAIIAPEWYQNLVDKSDVTFIFKEYEGRLLQSIVALIALSSLVTLFATFYYVQHIIVNIYKNIYFRKSNEQYFKKMLIAFSLFILSSAIGNIFYMKLYHHFTLSDCYILAGKAARDIMLWGFIYTIYVLFKEGLALQDNSDQII